MKTCEEALGEKGLIDWWNDLAVQIGKAMTGLASAMQAYDAAGEFQRGFMLAHYFWCIDDLAKVIDCETAARIDAESDLSRVKAEYETAKEQISMLLMKAK
jgi:hypothetical protein